MGEIRVTAKAEWWEQGDADDDVTIPPHHDVELSMYFEDTTFYIDGLKPGHYLAIELTELAKAIVANPR